MKVSEDKVSVIIVSLNGKDLLQDCLKSLTKFETVGQIIIVDNGSTDGSIEWLEKNYLDITLIKNSTNKGFAEANNQGLELSTGEYILFLNNDTIITQPFLKTLINTVKKPEIAAVQPLILFPNGTIDSIGSFFTNTGFLYHRAHLQKPKQALLNLEQTYSLKGACMLWKKNVLDKIGNFDSSYFAYFEETDLCHRAINAGFTLIVNPKVSIIHLGGSTSNKMRSEFIQYHSYKNRIQTYIKNLTLGQLFKILLIHLFLSAGIASITFFRNPSLSFAIYKGMFEGLYKGFKSRDNSKKRSLESVTKNPAWKYYIYLFKGLEYYKKIH